MYRLNKHGELYYTVSTIDTNMPKNKGKGGKAHRRGAKGGETSARELTFRGDMQDYGVVTAMLGDKRVELRDTKQKKRIGHICGKMKKKVWIVVGDVVLISLRDYQDSKCDIIHKYNADEVRNLKAYGEIADDSKEKDKEDVIFGQSGEASDEDGEYEHNTKTEVNDSEEEESSEEENV